MDKQAQIDYFEGLLAKHGENHQALDWNSRESQQLRYKIFQEIFIYGKKASSISLLDLGCGLGDLYGFLKKEKLLAKHRIKYRGYDISPKLIAAAKKKYSEASFEVKDILSERGLSKVDYIFCSGIFNIRTTETESHLEFVKNMLLRMYDLVNYGVAVNFLSEGALPLSDWDDLNSGRYHYFKPEEIIRFCRFICGQYILRHDYHLGDFTVYLLK